MKHVRLSIVAGILVILLIAAISIAQEESASEKAPVNRAVIQIDSLTCGGCFTNINAGLKPLDGYEGMGANLFRKLIAVDFVAPLTAESILDTLTQVGYPGTLKSVDPISEKESFAYQDSQQRRYRGGGGCCAAPGAQGEENYAPGAGCGAAGSCGAGPANQVPETQL